MSADCDAGSGPVATYDPTPDVSAHASVNATVGSRAARVMTPSAETADTRLLTGSDEIGSATLLALIIAAMASATATRSVSLAAV